MRSMVSGGLSCLALALFTACPYSDDDEETGESPVTDGLGLGETCDGPAQCETRLACASDGVCRPEGEPGTLPSGTDCMGNDWCAFGLVCSNFGVCATPGSSGTGGLGQPCSGDGFCQAGLSCGDEGVCSGVQLPLWRGATCEGTDGEGGDFRVLFEVPGAEPLSDFYRLPFPNDARVRPDGTLDLSDHPAPGALIPAFGDVVGAALESMTTDFGGFGNNQTIFLRFSDRVDYNRIGIGLPGEGHLALVDITPGSPTYGVRHPANWLSFTERRQYICDNWMAVTPLQGRPLTPGNTYALLLTIGVYKAETDDYLTRAPDFDAVLAATPPFDERLVHAWNQYAPLRAYLADTADHGWPASAIAGGTVFTVQDPQRFPPLLRQATEQGAAAAPEDMHLCVGPGGPFADAATPERGCPSTPSNAFHEVHGALSLPQFQGGTPPFKDASDGGAIRFDDGLPPREERRERVAFSLTIPKGVPMPEGGWPVVIYGHGTGGHFRSAVTEGLARDLSAVTLESDATVNFAVLTFEQPMHGTRRSPANWKQAWLDIDPSAYDPDVLYFNVLNPRAGRDNALQAAADAFSVVRAIPGFDWPAETSPIGEVLKLDPEQIHYLGHSQGAVAGAVWTPYEPALRSVVFSAGGGLLIESLVGKKSPHDLAAALRLGLVDPRIDIQHPVLNLVQMYSERADGVNHVGKLRRAGAQGPDILQIWGQGDTYSPDNTQYALARALDAWEVLGATPQKSGIRPDPDQVGNYTAIVEPVTSNWSDGRTGLVRYYEPVVGRDPHFVLFDRPDARKQAAHFLATAAIGPHATLVRP